LRPDAIVMDHSTTLPPATAARAARLAGVGVRYLHAPVFMSPQMCRDGKGLIMVSGPLPSSLDNRSGRTRRQENTCPPHDKEKVSARR